MTSPTQRKTKLEQLFMPFIFATSLGMVTGACAMLMYMKGPEATLYEAYLDIRARDFADGKRAVEQQNKRSVSLPVTEIDTSAKRQVGSVEPFELTRLYGPEIHEIPADNTVTRQYVDISPRGGNHHLLIPAFTLVKARLVSHYDGAAKTYEQHKRSIGPVLVELDEIAPGVRLLGRVDFREGLRFSEISINGTAEPVKVTAVDADTFASINPYSELFRYMSTGEADTPFVMGGLKRGTEIALLFHKEVLDPRLASYHGKYQNPREVVDGYEAGATSVLEKLSRASNAPVQQSN